MHAYSPLSSALRRSSNLSARRQAVRDSRRSKSHVCVLATTRVLRDLTGRLRREPRSRTARWAAATCSCAARGSMGAYRPRTRTRGIALSVRDAQIVNGGRAVVRNAVTSFYLHSDGRSHAIGMPHCMVTAVPRPVDDCDEWTLEAAPGATAVAASPDPSRACCSEAQRGHVAIRHHWIVIVRNVRSKLVLEAHGTPSMHIEGELAVTCAPAHGRASQQWRIVLDPLPAAAESVHDGDVVPNYYLRSGRAFRLINVEHGWALHSHSWGVTASASTPIAQVNHECAVHQQGVTAYNIHANNVWCAYAS